MRGVGGLMACSRFIPRKKEAHAQIVPVETSVIMGAPNPRHRLSGAYA